MLCSSISIFLYLAQILWTSCIGLINVADVSFEHPRGRLRCIGNANLFSPSKPDLFRYYRDHVRVIKNLLGQHWLREFTFIYLYFLQKIISRKLKNVLLFINLFKRLCTMVIYYWLNWNSIASYVAVLWSVRKFSFGATVTLSDIVLWESKWHIINRRIYFKYHDINVVSYKIILFSIIFYCYNLNHSLKEWDRY